MEKRKEYERTDLELIYFDSPDVITTSGVLGGESSSWDNNGWT